MSKKRYPAIESFARLTDRQLALEIDRSLTQTRKVIERAFQLGLLRQRIHARGQPRSYDAIEAETIKAMLAIPARPAPQPRDWLSDYLKENTHARRKRARAPHHPRTAQSRARGGDARGRE